MTYLTPAVEKIIHVSSYQQNSKIAWHGEIKREHQIICKIVKPLENKHFGTTHFVHYREVVFSLEAKIYNYRDLKVCLYREAFSMVSFIGDCAVYLKYLLMLKFG